MHTALIFDATTKPFPWPAIWPFVGQLAFGCFVVFLSRKWRSASRVLGYLFVASAIILVCRDAGRWFVLRHRHIQMLSTGHYDVLEGVVEKLHPMPSDGSSSESFTIAGHTFYYSNYSIYNTSNCFDQTAAHGGPIRSGMILRVTFVDGCILRIEELPHH